MFFSQHGHHIGIHFPEILYIESPRFLFFIYAKSRSNKHLISLPGTPTTTPELKKKPQHQKQKHGTPITTQNKLVIPATACSYRYSLVFSDMIFSRYKPRIHALSLHNNGELCISIISVIKILKIKQITYFCFYFVKKRNIFTYTSPWT